MIGNEGRMREEDYNTTSDRNRTKDTKPSISSLQPRPHGIPQTGEFGRVEVDDEIQIIVPPPKPLPECVDLIDSDTDSVDTDSDDRTDGTDEDSLLEKEKVQIEKALEVLYSARMQVIAWPFYNFSAVDPELHGFYDYYEIVKKPMDLDTIQNKMKNRGYIAFDEFAADVRLTFTNCYKYYPETNAGEIARKLLRAFESKYSDILNLPPRALSSDYDDDEDDSDNEDEDGESEQQENNENEDDEEEDDGARTGSHRTSSPPVQQHQRCTPSKRNTSTPQPVSQDAVVQNSEPPGGKAKTQLTTKSSVPVQLTDQPSNTTSVKNIGNACAPVPKKLLLNNAQLNPILPTTSSQSTEALNSRSSSVNRHVPATKRLPDLDNPQRQSGAANAQFSIQSSAVGSNSTLMAKQLSSNKPQVQAVSSGVSALESKRVQLANQSSTDSVTPTVKNRLNLPKSNAQDGPFKRIESQTRIVPQASQSSKTPVTPTTRKSVRMQAGLQGACNRILSQTSIVPEATNSSKNHASPTSKNSLYLNKSKAQEVPWNRIASQATTFSQETQSSTHSVPTPMKITLTLNNSKTQDVPCYRISSQVSLQTSNSPPQVTQSSGNPVTRGMKTPLPTNNSKAREILCNRNAPLATIFSQGNLPFKNPVTPPIKPLTLNKSKVQDVPYNRISPQATILKQATQSSKDLILRQA